jgi:hypothetical protein
MCGWLSSKMLSQNNGPALNAHFQTNSLCEKALNHLADEPKYQEYLAREMEKSEQVHPDDQQAQFANEVRREMERGRGG